MEAASRGFDGFTRLQHTLGADDDRSLGARGVGVLREPITVLLGGTTIEDELVTPPMSW